MLKKIISWLNLVDQYISAVITAAVTQPDAFGRLGLRLNSLEEQLMTTFTEITSLQAEQAAKITAVLTAQAELLVTIAAEQTEFKSVMEKFMADAAANLTAALADKIPLANLAPYVAQLKVHNERLTQAAATAIMATDAVKAVVPTVETPAEPTPVPPAADVPVAELPDPIEAAPVELETIPAPEDLSESDVVVEETAPDVAFDGTPSITLEHDAEHVE